MIAYVLLVSFAVIMSVIVYKYIESIAKGAEGVIECPDGTSLFIKDYAYNCSEDELNLILKNNGRFSIGGYFIHATSSPEQELATEDLSGFSHQVKAGNIIIFVLGFVDNPFKPNEEATHTFNLSTASFAQIYSVEITPLRWQVEDNKKTIVSCGNSKIKEVISCS